MSTVGIVCEYNPFHKGHEYQIQQAKLLTGAEHVICFMSGNFLQRGVPAIADKHTRTRDCFEMRCRRCVRDSICIRIIKCQRLCTCRSLHDERS
ncbi:MAG: nucleotidyltransferase family protein [Coprococcus sp.]